MDFTEEGEEFPQFDADPDVAVAQAEANAQREAVDRVASGSQDPDDLADATAWFMSDEPSPAARKTFGVNVGQWNEDKQEYDDFVVNWTVEAISREDIRSIQRMSRPARQRARGGEQQVDPMNATLGIAAKGTVEPDLAGIAAQLGTQDVGEVLRRRMAHKPGLIDQIAGEVLAVSGYDDEDIRDVAAVRG